MEQWKKISIDTSGRNDIFHNIGLVAFSTLKELQSNPHDHFRKQQIVVGVIVDKKEKKFHLV